MRTSFGQKTQVPGHGNGLVSTVTGVTPESVRTGRSRSRRTNSDSSRGPRARERAEARDDLRLREQAAAVLRVAAHDPVEAARVERGIAQHRVDDRA